MKTKIIPFDLETAKKIQAGEIEGKIKTEGGKNARVICWDKKNEHHMPIVALIDNIQREEFYLYSEAGEYDLGHHPILNLVLEVPDNEPQFKPFDRVLCRDGEYDVWTANLYSHMVHDDSFPYRVLGDVYYRQCIPYAGNENLVGTTDKPKEE